MSGPGVPLGLRALDEENLEFCGRPEDYRYSGLGVSLTWLGLAPELGLVGEPVNESTQANVWNLHLDAPGVRLPDMFVKLRLKSDRKPIFQNPAGKIDEIARVPDG